MARGVIPLGLRKGEGVIPAAPMSNFTNKPLSTVWIFWMVTVLIDYYEDGGNTPFDLGGRRGNAPPPLNTFTISIIISALPKQHSFNDRYVHLNSGMHGRREGVKVPPPQESLDKEDKNNGY